ncbi:Protein phosphatase 2C homolog 4 [Sparassis crispa]|uniref:Protein phosphatase 2C homolog 4 n=1 Tax=Sparassis crispa TaxID=139825 RepID=A0A401G6R9_9APHY|nr:Protein phosphatase 2C homolog 4 [Sparassis crispa]GBE77866.1 Protein phosphatase 2C homolog 4 [Sparassis crispa]
MAFRLWHSFQSPVLTKSRPRTFVQKNIARYHDYIRFSTPGGSARLLLNNPKIIGVASSRGERLTQEDFYSFVSLSLNPEELRLSLKKSFQIDWDPSALPDALARQVLFVGIYDGHGGSTVSGFLRQELHGLFENVDKSQIPELFAWAKELGGYFKRFKGGALAPWIRPSSPDASQELDLEARATLAFFEVDRMLAIENAAKECGATASVVLLQSLDNSATPFFASEKIALTVAHVGDTRVLLCSMDGGKFIPMTENHHADARVETARLRRMMVSSLIADSFGETRWMGALANTRSLGDMKFKPYGVTPEPEVRTHLVQGGEFSHITLLSDGVSSVVSDDEITDLARGALSPRHAAQRILAYAEEMGSEDNATVIVVPLAGWGKVSGEDKTRELREYRRRNMVGSERQKERWM